MNLKSKQAQELYDKLIRIREMTPEEQDILIKYDNEIYDLMEIILKNQEEMGKVGKIFVDETKKDGN